MRKDTIIIALVIYILISTFCFITYNRDRYVHLFYNEFDDNYLILIDGSVYTFEENELDFINEFEDIEIYNLYDYIENI